MKYVKVLLSDGPMFDSHMDQSWDYFA